jgi:hypothetical protein
METSGIFTTAREAPVLTANGDNTSTVVISVVENRAREISICKIDTRNVILMQQFLPIARLLC